MRYCKIIAALLVLVALSGCRSHRNVTSHEEARWQRTIQDSAVAKVDTMARRDSVSLSWVASGLSLEVDSVDYRITWDSVGRPSRIAGKRVMSQRSSSAGQKAAAAVVEETREEARYQRAVQDSTVLNRVEDKHVETQAGWRPRWLELACMAVLLVLAVGGVLHLRDITERWSKRR